MSDPQTPPAAPPAAPPGDAAFIAGLANILEGLGYHASQELLRRTRMVGMSLPVWRVLMALSKTEAAPVSVLAERCYLQQPTMTKLLDRMVDARLVARRQDARDRRVVEIYLTEAGRRQAAALAAIGEGAARVLLERNPGLGHPAVREALARGLGRPGQ